MKKVFSLALGLSGGVAFGQSAPLDLTIYKADFAMVHERRTLDLRSGANHVRLGGVSRVLDPNSVDFKTPSGTRVSSMTYDLGIGSSGRLLQRLAGKEVDLVLDQDSGRAGQRLHGVLEPSADGGFLLRTADSLYVNPRGTLVAPSDSDVDTMPGLAVQVSSAGSGSQELGLSYLTRGMSWQADYVAHLDPDRKHMKLECWASVTNQTGIPFKDARLTFVAGEPNRAVEAAPPAKVETLARRTSANSGGFASDMPTVSAPIAVGELYEYKADGAATLGVDQISRVRMFDKPSVPVKIDYSVELPPFDGWDVGSPMPKQSAQMAIKFENGVTGGLGFPLPSGSVRVFETDGESDRYTGADTVVDLAKDAKSTLTLSKVFDVSAEPVVIKAHRLSKHVTRRTLRVVLRNAKKMDTTVRIVQTLPSSLSVWHDGERPVKLSASQYQWSVVVPAGGTKTVTSTFDLRI